MLGAGRNQMYIASMSAVLGGNVRVGLEDSLWLGKGRLAQTNAEQVAKIRRILEELGLEVATPDDARRIATNQCNDVRHAPAVDCGAPE